MAVEGKDGEEMGLDDVAGEIGDHHNLGLIHVHGRVLASHESRVTHTLTNLAVTQLSHSYIRSIYSMYL
jgi:hypothetical protein